MKRIAFVSAFILLLVAAITLLVTLPSTSADTPGLAPAPPLAPFSSYNWMCPRPFNADKMWIFTQLGALPPVGLVYDLERHQVLGQVTNAWPEMLFGDPARLLCSQPMATNALKQWFFSFVARLSGGRMKGPTLPRTLPMRPFGATFWILDLKNGTAKKLGDIPGIPSTLVPSPDSHYCFTARTTGNTRELYLLDLQRPSLQKIHVPGGIIDWWDNAQLLLEGTNGTFLLYDVRKRATTPVTGLENVADFLEEKGISGAPSKTGCFTIWNGQQNDFYFTDLQQRWLAAESFLVKVERPDGRFKLVSPRFKFEWSDHIDPTGRYYLYSGRQAGNESDGVFLRDLANGTNRVLVAPTTNAYFSIPRFYRDSVIYIRSNALWQINLDGSSNVRLYPEVKPQEQAR